MVQVYRPGKRTGTTGGRSKAGPAKAASKKSNQVGKVIELSIDAIDHEAKGVSRGRITTFVTGALPGERCKVKITGQQRGVQQAQLIEVLEPSTQRQTPFCPHYDRCGGCQTQHLQHDWFLAEKQQALSFLINKLTGAGNNPLPWTAPITGRQTGYRRKARLAVDARDKNDVRLGFRDNQNAVFSVMECQVLTAALQCLITPLKALLPGLNCVKKLGHLSLFDGGLADVQDPTVDGGHLYLIIRLSEIPNAQDCDLLRQFEQAQQCSIILHLDNNQFVDLQGVSAHLNYHLYLQDKAFNFSLHGNDFVQVNDAINHQMVTQALDWLDLSANDRVLDLFCGVGNFSLPIAQHCQWVTGYEGIPEMVQMAHHNGQLNQINNLRFISGDLTAQSTLATLTQDPCNKVLLDPARAGALEVVQMLLILQPEVIVYVSCNPATFGRDIACLLEANYQLNQLSLIDMFPGTAHSELMGVFSRV